MFLQHNVTHVVRVCDPTYSIETIEAAGIAVHVRSCPPASLFLHLLGAISFKMHMAIKFAV